MHGKQNLLPAGSSTQPGMWQSIHWTCHAMPTQPDFISLCSPADQMQKPGLEEGSVECRKGRLSVSFATYQLSNLRVWYHSGISVYWKLGISAYCLHLAGDLKKLWVLNPSKAFVSQDSFWSQFLADLCNYCLECPPSSFLQLRSHPHIQAFHSFLCSAPCSISAFTKYCGVYWDFIVKSFRIDKVISALGCYFQGLVECLDQDTW